MNITPENALSVVHSSWLQDPTTKQMLQNLQKYEESCVNKMVIDSGDSAIPDEMFRMQANCIKTVRTLRTMISNTEQFIAVSVK